MSEERKHTTDEALNLVPGDMPTSEALFDEIAEHPERSGALADALRGLHPAEFADQFEQLAPEARETLVELLPEAISAEVLAELEDEVVEDILPLLPSAQIAGAIAELDNDDATQIVEEMEDAQRAEVLAELDADDRADLEAALAFEEDEVGRLMQRDFVAAPEDWTVGQTIDHMRKTGEDLPEVFFNIYVVDAEFRPQGYVTVSRLMRSARKEKLRDLMVLDLRSIDQRLDKEEAAYIFETYHLISAPVVDEAGVIQGIMTVDDILDIIQDENKEDMLRLANAGDAGITDTALSVVRTRAPWLVLNLLTAILASLVIAQFDEAIAQVVALAILMPIVASMGGNAGTQALAVAVRQLSERDLTSRTAWRAVRREAVAAVVIGFIFATVMAAIALVWFGRRDLAMVIFIAMVVNHVAAGLAGIAVPLGLKRAGADPAVASSVFVTTVTDVVGFFAFLGLAVVMLV